MKFDFEDFAAAAKQIEHIADCTLKKVGNRVEIMVEAYLAKDDGTVEHGYALVELMPWMWGEGKWEKPGRWLLTTFDHSIEKQWEGFTRYATADEIAAYKAGEVA